MKYMDCTDIKNSWKANIQERIKEERDDRDVFVVILIGRKDYKAHGKDMQGTYIYPFLLLLRQFNIKVKIEYFYKESTNTTISVISYYNADNNCLAIIPYIEPTGNSTAWNRAIIDAIDPRKDIMCITMINRGYTACYCYEFYMNPYEQVVSRVVDVFRPSSPVNRSNNNRFVVIEEDLSMTGASDGIRTNLLNSYTNACVTTLYPYYTTDALDILVPDAIVNLGKRSIKEHNLNNAYSHMNSIIVIDFGHTFAEINTMGNDNVTVVDCYALRELISIAMMYNIIRSFGLNPAIRHSFSRGANHALGKFPPLLPAQLEAADIYGTNKSTTLGDLI